MLFKKKMDRNCQLSKTDANFVDFLRIFGPFSKIDVECLKIEFGNLFSFSLSLALSPSFTFFLTTKPEGNKFTQLLKSIVINSFKSSALVVHFFFEFIDTNLNMIFYRKNPTLTQQRNTFNIVFGQKIKQCVWETPLKF